MDSNSLFLIIIAVLLICFFAGRRAGLIRALIPIAAAFASFWLLVSAYPVFREDITEDIKGFAINDAAADVIAFAVTFLLLKWLIKKALRIFRIIGDAPVIGAVNRFLGGMAGIAGGVIIIWTVFFFILLYAGQQGFPEFYEAVNGNEFVKLLYNNNLILTFVNYFVFVA